MKLRHVFPLLALAVIGCPSAPRFPDYDITEFPSPLDGGYDAELDDVSEDCVMACLTLARFRCPEAKSAGRTCSSVCEAADRAGMYLNTKCIATSRSLADLRACGTVRCEIEP